MRRVLLLILLIPTTCLAQKKLVPLKNIAFDDSDKSEMYSVIRTDGLIIFVENLEVRKDLLIFDVEIKNETGSNLEIDPQAFYIYGSGSTFPDIHNKSWEGSLDHNEVFLSFARSQQDVGHYYEKRIQSRQNTKTIMALIGTGLVVFDAINDARDFNSEYSPHRAKNSFARDVMVETSLTAMQIVDNAISKEQAKSDEDRYYLSEEYLYPDTIDTGESRRGKVYFFPHMKTRYYRLMIPLNGLLYVFDFGL